MHRRMARRASRPEKVSRNPDLRGASRGVNRAGRWSCASAIHIAQQAEATAAAPRCERGLLDGDVFAVLVFVWLVSLIRLGAAVWMGESLGQELGLALGGILVLPWIGRANVVDAWRRR